MSLLLRSLIHQLKPMRLMGYNWPKKEMENSKNIETQNRIQLLKAKLLLLLFSITFFLSSCAISNKLSIGDSRYLDVYCQQILNDNEILATYTEEGKAYAVKIITYGDHYSRWQRIRGDFTCVDFFAYETVEDVINIVPVFIKTSDYEKYKKGH